MSNVQRRALIGPVRSYWSACQENSWNYWIRLISPARLSSNFKRENCLEFRTRLKITLIFPASEFFFPQRSHALFRTGCKSLILKITQKNKHIPELNNMTQHLYHVRLHKICYININIMSSIYFGLWGDWLVEHPLRHHWLLKCITLTVYFTENVVSRLALADKP